MKDWNLKRKGFDVDSWLQNIQAAREHKSCFPNLDGNFRCVAGCQLFSSVLKSNSADRASTQMTRQSLQSHLYEGWLTFMRIGFFTCEMEFYSPGASRIRITWELARSGAHPRREPSIVCCNQPFSVKSG
ncbi:BCLAF1 and THRAP3 family member 3 isoform X6 [Phocoena sinus]|uniref:BCLAF1 and THRAP3 family member 3 isoform X6 n=1 Tax=Phocoena sinus TaxID=42100 RepID=UPI0013C4FC9E|nr:BCLAF1 and THRAP3 family member 3 isoform X6 [Phocoena sinus]